MVTYQLLKTQISYEQDIVYVRQRARTIAALLGFERNYQSRIATALSEIARNAYQYAGGGSVEFAVEGKAKPQSFSITVTDSGPGIKDIEAILEGRYKSKTGMGMGIIGARKLMDQFHIEGTVGKGIVVKMGRTLPLDAPLVTRETANHIVSELSRKKPEDPYEEIQQQNQELMNALDELRQGQVALEQANFELKDTNRGVVALYAELDEKATHLADANELKARFLSNMSHEFRTPLNSIISLSCLLLEKVDGALNEEQLKQVTYIQKSASALSILINDLLDIAKIEAGKIIIKPADFEVSALFSTLRGMLRPLLLNPNVEFTIEEPTGISTLYTDEGKLSQILRNLISNAIKFTEKGQIRLMAGLSKDEETITFSVADTGIGIAKEYQESIFNEYSQVESDLQRKLKGTGLGLSISRKLAQLLGGNITVESTPGKGSVFAVIIPRNYPAALGSRTQHQLSVVEDVTRYPLLIIEDDQSVQLLYEKYLQDTRFQLFPAYSLKEARAILKTTRPLAIVLDIMLPDEDGWSFMSELKAQNDTKEIPILVVTISEDRERGLMLGAEDYCTKPVERKWLLEKLKKVSGKTAVQKVLIIDDEEVARYIMKGLLTGTRSNFIEASGGVEGLEKARREKPDVIFLDLMMPEMNGFQVLEQLKKDRTTRNIPVIIVTSKVLEKDELGFLNKYTQAILAKGQISSELVITMLREALTKIISLQRSEGGNSHERGQKKYNP